MTLTVLLILALQAPNGEALQKDSREGIHTPDLTARARDNDGVVMRSQSRRRLFLKATGYTTKGRPGCVVDHIVPLACGGVDIPSNMAWQCGDEGPRKDRWELDCKKWQDGTYLRLLQKAIDEERKTR